MPRQRRKDGKRRFFAEKQRGKGTWIYADDPEAGRFLGGRSEGNVYGGKYVVKRGSRERTVKLAEKVFYKKTPRNRMLRNPEKQFELVRELMELNRKKKLGLRLPPTVRLLKREGRPTLLATWYRDRHGQELKAKHMLAKDEKAQYAEDRDRQIEALKSEGYTVTNEWDDKFEPYLDPRTGKYVALLLDFGGLVRKKK